MFIKPTVIAMFLLINNQSIAANIDFEALNNSASENCINNIIKENCTNANYPNEHCQPLTNIKAGTHESCVNVKAKEKYLEPKFSTSKPRGQ